MTIRRFAVIVTAVLMLAGCGSSTPSSSTTPTPPQSSPPSASSTPVLTPSPTPTSSSPAPVAVATCTSNIRVSAGESQGAAGHLTLVLIFNNVGHDSCRIYGYPGLDLVTASGATVAHARRTLSGMAGGASALTAITLAPGASASALVEASDVPQGAIADCGSYSLMVTPPGQYTAVGAGRAMMPKCALEIHPVVAGTHGGMR